MHAWIDARVLGRGSTATTGPRSTVAEAVRVRKLHAVLLFRLAMRVAVNMHEHVYVVMYVHDFEYTLGRQ